MPHDGRRIEPVNENATDQVTAALLGQQKQIDLSRFCRSFHANVTAFQLSPERKLL